MSSLLTLPKNISELPPEVLVKIFAYLSPGNELHSVRKVSKQWERIIDDFIGLAIVVGLQRNSYFVDYPSDSLNRQVLMAAYSWTTFPSKEIKNLFLQDSTFVTTPNLKDPLRIRKLILVGNIDRNIILAVTQPLCNLRGLCLHISIFENSRLFSSRLKFVLSNLKYFVLDDTGSMLSTEDYDVNEIFDNASSLLEVSEFDSLERFAVEFPFYEGREAIFTNSIVQFIERHCNTLKALTIHQKYEIETPEDEKPENRSDTDENGDDESNCKHDVTIKMLSKNALRLKNVNLEEICISLCEDQECSPLWKNFLAHQSKLKKLFYINYEIPFPEGLIKTNISTLTVLVVNIKTCANFSCFTEDCRITTLVLVGKYKKEPEIDIPDVRNLYCLPSSVRTLKFNGVTALASDIRKIALEKPNLEDLILEDAGMHYNLGMTLETYGLLLNNKKLKHFRLKNSFNIISFTEYENIPKNVEGLSTVFLDSKRGIVVEGYLNEDKDRYIMNGNLKAHEDLEGQGLDVFNLLSGITDAKTWIHDGNESRSDSEDGTSDNSERSSNSESSESEEPNSNQNSQASHSGEEDTDLDDLEHGSSTSEHSDLEDAEELELEASDKSFGAGDVPDI